MPNLKINVNNFKRAIILILILPLNGNVVLTEDLDSGQNGSTESAQQMFRRMDGE